MKKILLLLLLFTGIVKGQIVTIPNTLLRDALISNACVDLNNDGIGDADVDTNNDLQIQVSEAEAVNRLYLGILLASSGIGLEAFVNLQYLQISFISFTGVLDFTSLTQLKFLDCSQTYSSGINVTDLNQLETLICNGCLLSSLDVSTLTSLKRLNCEENSLTTLDINGLNNLSILDCSNNQLTTLNVSGLSQLNSLICSSNQLTTLNLIDLTNLSILNCSNNQLTSLDFSGLSNLDFLNCSNNHLTTLDLSGNPIFNGLNCSNNNLIYINIKNGFEMIDLDLSDFSLNPNLSYVCIDNDEYEIISIYLPQTEFPNVNFNTYCSFFPGSDYNTITGTTLYDSLGDGCDLNDIANPYVKVNINDGTNSGSTFINNSGNYTFYTQAGDFTITPQVENPSYFFISPANAVLTFPLLDNSTQTQNFCVTPNGVHPDVEIVFVPTNTARPGLEARYKMVYKNKGNQTLSGTITLSFNSTLLTYNLSIPVFNLLQQDLFTWNYTNLNPFETRTIELNLLLHTPPEINIGDTLDFVATINPIPGDETPLDNVSTFNQTVVNSADPNQIQCLEGNTITTEEVGNYLHYNINFENIGTAEALNIVVKDTINTAKFDVNSLQLQYASHNVETKITGNILELIFKNINLPSAILNPIGGHGNVLFKIKTIPTLVVGDNVESRANIYFDYNDPIATNEAITSITALSNPDFVRDKTIVIAPNPTKNNITVSSKNNIQSIQLFDVQGRILQTVLENKNSTTLDISNKSDGIYFLKVTTEVGSSVEKLVKEN
jgi:hypothetical protein